MKLTEFAKERNVPRDTITQYIRRNPDLFEGHTKVDGKWLIIDDVAEEHLNEKYPLPQMVQIVEDTESRQKLLKAQEAIIQLQGKLQETATQLAQAEATKLLLEDKQEQLAKTELKLAEAEQRERNANEEIIELQQKLEIASKRVAELGASQKLLEDKEAQLEKAENRLSKAEDALATERAEAREQMAKLLEELARERSKTWVQKLFGKG